MGSDSEALIVVKRYCPVTEDVAAVADFDDAVRRNHGTKALLAEAEKICGPMAHENTLDFDSDDEDGDELEESLSAYTEEEHDLGDGSSDRNICGERFERDEGSEYSSYIEKSDSPNKPRCYGEVIYVRKSLVNQ